MKPVLVFDMDGVLVDATESYRETIARTVEHFAGVQVAREQIQDYKNQGGWNDDRKLSRHIIGRAGEGGQDYKSQGGWNDDWKLSHHIIGRTGVDVPFEPVKQSFQELFLGDGSNGMILRERWVAREGVLEKLGERFRLA